MSDLVRLYYKKKITDEISRLHGIEVKLSNVAKSGKYFTGDGVSLIINKIIEDLEMIIQK